MKKSTILFLTMALVMIFATSAFAAQVSYSVYDSNTGLNTKYYTSTTPNISNPDATTTATRTYVGNKFTADGVSNYPYEIYLPNEKHPESYRIHTNYTKNTDACASCHATHTAVGDSLLQWYSVYETCMACHDGTVTTTYNVVAGNIGSSGMPTSGGAFGTGTEGSRSNHNVTGAVQIAAAPGGSVVPETVGTNTRWATQFGCESCHSPHGQGGNARILNPDPNYFASQRAATSGASSTGLAANIADTDTTSSHVYYSVAPSGATAAVDNVGNGYYFIKGYPYSVKVLVNGVNMSSSFTIDNTLGYTRAIYTGSDSTIDATYNAGQVKIIGVPSVKISMNIQNYLQANESVSYGNGMNVFCGTCHQDYNTMTAANYNGTSFSGSAANETGTYSKAHRHQVGQAWHGAVPGLKFEAGNRVACLTCHVAHGTNEDYWTRTLTQPGQAWAGLGLDLRELAGSSALKRMPNMGTCNACHNKTDGNQGYQANTSENLSAVYNGTAATAPSQTDGFFKVSTAFIGDNLCVNCHQQKVDGFNKTGHSQAAKLITAYTITNFSNNQPWITKLDKNAATTIAVYPSDIKFVMMDTYAISESVPGYAYRIAHLNKNADGSYTLGYADTTNSAGAGWGPVNLGSSAPITGGDCTICHGDGLRTSDLSGTNGSVVCESCHGGAANHVKQPNAKNITNPRNLTIDQQIAVCARCHTGDNYISGNANNRTVENTTKWDNHRGTQDFAGSQHFVQGVLSCETCHDMHSTNADGMPLKGAYNQLCATCHDQTFDINQYMPYNSNLASNPLTAGKPNFAGVNYTADPYGHNTRDHGFGWVNNTYKY